MSIYIYMITDIIPITKLPRGIVDTFSYIVPKELEESLIPGLIVVVPLRNKEVQGIVKTLKKKADNEEDLKKVLDIVFPLPLITQQQLNIARFVAQHALTSLSSSIRLCVPDIPKTKLEVYAKDFILPKVITNKESAPSTIIAPDAQQGIPKEVLSTIKKATKLGEQVLYMVPERIRLERVYEALNTAGIKNILTWSNTTSKHTLFKEYLNVRANNVQIIIGTRSALFAPYAHLTHIFMEDEYNDSYKSDQTPRYHARNVVRELAKLHKASLTYISRVPSVEMYSEFDFRNKQRSAFITDVKNISIIDMREEHKKKNFSLLSENLDEQITKALAKNKKAFLFLNRRGHSTGVSCEDCGYVMNCAQCELPYTLHSNNLLQCHHCRKKTDLPPLCPKCSGPNIKLTGKGTQKVELVIKKRFPNANIVRVDTDSLSNHELQITNYDIVIGTEFALPRTDWTNVHIIGVIHADTALYRPDFRSGERTFQLLHQLYSYAPEETSFILQTYTPEHYVFQSVAQGTPELFYKKEIDVRKTLGYPPFRSMIKLIFRDKDDKKAIGEAMHMYHRLRKHLLSRDQKPKAKNAIKSITTTEQAKKPTTIDIVRPFPGHPKISAGRYQFNLIVRVDNRRRDFVIEQLQELLSPGWVIDTDPETLL